MTMKHLWRSLVLSLAVAASGSAWAQSAHERFEASVKTAVAPLVGGAVTGMKVLYLGAEHSPWLDSGFPVKAGDRVTVLLQGRVWLSRHYDISLEAPLQLWRRIGENGAISRGLDATDTFTVAESGTVQLKNLPTRWLDAKGRYQGEAPPASPDAGGGISVALIRWAPDADVAATLAALALQPAAPDWAAPALARLQSPPAAPEGWQYLWELGPAEIFREVHADDDGGPRRRMHTHTRNDVAILQKPAEIALTPDTELKWSWRVDQLPGKQAENSVITHDYISIAVEFDNGQDLTYLWSSTLPVGETFRCPLPGWKDRETHVVARSGSADLGRWLNESRNVLQDYAKAVGGPPPQRIVRVWLIANSVFGRGEGRAQFGDIRIGTGGADLAVW
ncbi:DUF3047 domain-containing protein [Methyloversatilis discipulorum]|uniref:DUF3047 domain-containing protein n=1 Tax=Methyloversatilis discipulorum TaxID=1119528 RepID=UPI001A628B60|nr:DUF3047 domain-containing protein [Methyloversatilis discipulorum]MBL8467151.1 DUF3047 domain-containing protein [Methyloversatilis discipulorum]